MRLRERIYLGEIVAAEPSLVIAVNIAQKLTGDRAFFESLLDLSID